MRVTIARGYNPKVKGSISTRDLCNSLFPFDSFSHTYRSPFSLFDSSTESACADNVR